MAKAIIARRKGDEYQALKFWLHLLELRISDFVDSVCLESDRVSFVDDIVVRYSSDYCEQATGKRVKCDYIQCKYHVTGQGAFTFENLIDPDFINSKSSMLSRLFDAYQHLREEEDEFRLNTDTLRV